MAKTSQSFKLINQEILSNCYSFIAELYAKNQDKDKSLNVTVELADKDKARSLAQNRLYWQWVKIIADYTGLSKDEQHTELKYKHLARIYNRDYPDVAEVLNKVRECKGQVPTSVYHELTMGVASLLSTTRATTKQMTEYLDDIDKFYYGQGLPLPKPDDYQWIMGEV